MEIIKKEETESRVGKKELERLLEKWLEKLQPYGEEGYHS